MLYAIYKFFTLILILVIILLQIINTYATMFNSLWVEKSVRHALSSFDSKFLISVGKDSIVQEQMILLLTRLKCMYAR